MKIVYLQIMENFHIYQTDKTKMECDLITPKREIPFRLSKKQILYLPEKKKKKKKKKKNSQLLIIMIITFFFIYINLTD